MQSRFSRWSDERRLDFHAGLGSIAFERSTSGAQYERMKMFHVERPEGWRDIVTAWPRKMREQPQAVEPDQEMMVEYGTIGRRLMRMPPLLRAALQLWHGDSGAYWATQRRGRVVALFWLVPHGRKLLDMERRRADSAQLELSDRGRLANVLDADAQQDGADQLRRRLITIATRESEGLLAAAQKAWRATAPRESA